MRRARSFILLTVGVTQLVALSPANSTICKPWKCINEKIGLNSQESGLVTFERNILESYLSSLLPEARWKDSITVSLDSCLADKKPRSYSTTCPGQETWHCIVDQLTKNCPDSNLKKENSCTSISSLVGANYLFYQNTYVNIDGEIRNDHRNKAFLRNIFNSKCCVLPSLLTTSVVAGCGVSIFLHVENQQTHSLKRPAVSTPLPVTPDVYCSRNTVDNINPLECCDTSELVASRVFDTCDVSLEWQRDDRFMLIDEEVRSSTTEPAITEAPIKRKSRNDIKVAPESCSGITCVFKNLNIISDTGSINKDAYTSLLVNMTSQHPEWASAKARVLTRCLQRDLRMEYEGCDVAKLVACTLDVLAENCPHSKKGFSDPCRHPSRAHNTSSVCQVSTSKYKRVRHRYCDVPLLAPPSALRDCGLISLHRLVTVTGNPNIALKKISISRKPMCIPTSNTTKCVLDKLEILNKYKFMDSLKMKEFVDTLTRKHYHWAAHKVALEYALTFMPHYKNYCVSTRKLLNVLDAAITNCPFSKRTFTSKCTRFFGYIDRCTNKTNSNINPAPTRTRMISHLISPPLNVRFQNSTVPVSRIYAPVNRTISRYSKYAKSYPYYVSTSNHVSVRRPFGKSKFPPTNTNSNLNIFLPRNGGNLGQPISGAYSPIYSHGHVSYIAVKPNNSDPKLPLLVKDNFRTSNPFLIHDKIANAHKYKNAVQKVESSPQKFVAI